MSSEITTTAPTTSPEPTPTTTIEPTTTTTEPTTTRQPRLITFPVNITFQTENISYYADMLQHDVPADRRLEFFNTLSDSMRQENKFQDDDYLSEFANLFYWVLSQSNKHSSGTSFWTKKVERKNLKRFLKFAFNSEALNPLQEASNSGCSGDEPYVPYKWLSKSFYQSLLTHTETEGYEILMEAIELRNLTLSMEQMKAVQCLYYGSYSGMKNGQAYLFSSYDEEWDLRNALFGKPLVLQSLRSLVSELTGLSSPSSSTNKMSKFMEEILTVFSEYKTKLDQETKTRPRSSPRYFHDVAAKLEGSLMGMGKWDNFIDFDSKDIMMGAGLEVVFDATGEAFDPDRTPIVFDPYNRQSWYYLQLFRPAGSQVFEKYEEFLSKMVVDKITTVYKARLFRRRFTSAFLHIRLLPTGPLILKACETLERLMREAEPRDKEDNRVKIENFNQTLLFLRGLYSDNEDVLANLPQQIQFLTNPALNQNLKLMLKYIPKNSTDGHQFAEVGVTFGQNGPMLNFKQFPFIPSENETAESNFQNEWQFQLGYFRGFTETLFAPVIKANIFLNADLSGGLDYTWRDGGRMVYEIFNEGDVDSKGFWDLKLLPHEQSFQLIHHGRLEQFFSIVFDEEGKFPVSLAANHFIPDSIPRNFVPAEFIVVPGASGDYF